MAAVPAETRLTMPWPPSLNGIWRAFGGRIILSVVARRYKKAAAGALPRGRVAPPLTGRLLVWMTLHPPVKMGSRKWDIANREKLMIDTMTDGRVWLDDSQIDALVMLRGAPAGAGHVDIIIQPCEGSPL